MDAITRGWAIVTSAEVIRLGLGLVASLVIARVLGPAGYGVYAVLAAVVGVVGALAEGGLSEAAVLRLAKHWSVTSATAFVWLRVGLAAAVVASACLVAEPAARLLRLDDDGTLTRFALFGIIATACSGALSVLLQAAGRFGQMSTLTIFNTALTTLLAVLLALSGQLSVATALIVLGLGTSLATFAFGLGLARMPLTLPRLVELRTEAASLAPLARWLWLASVLAMLAAHLDVLIVTRFVPLELVGAYALASNVAGKASIVNHSLYTVLLPRVAHLGAGSSVRAYVRRSLARGALVALAVAACIPFAEPFIVVVYGQAFAPAAPLLQALLGVVIFDLLATPIVLLPLAYGRPRQMAAADAVRAITLGVAGLGLVPLIGPPGAVIARLASRVAGAGLVVSLLGRSGSTFEVEHEESAQASQAG